MNKNFHTADFTKNRGIPQSKVEVQLPNTYKSSDDRIIDSYETENVFMTIFKSGLLVYRDNETGFVRKDIIDIYDYDICKFHVSENNAIYLWFQKYNNIYIYRYVDKSIAFELVNVLTIDDDKHVFDLVIKQSKPVYCIMGDYETFDNDNTTHQSDYLNNTRFCKLDIDTLDPVKIAYNQRIYKYDLESASFILNEATSDNEYSNINMNNVTGELVVVDINGLVQISTSAITRSYDNLFYSNIKLNKKIDYNYEYQLYYGLKNSGPGGKTKRLVDSLFENECIRINNIVYSQEFDKYYFSSAYGVSIANKNFTGFNHGVCKFDDMYFRYIIENGLFPCKYGLLAQYIPKILSNTDNSNRINVGDRSMLLLHRSSDGENFTPVDLTDCCDDIEHFSMPGSIIKQLSDTEFILFSMNTHECIVLLTLTEDSYTTQVIHDKEITETVNDRFNSAQVVKVEDGSVFLIYSHYNKHVVFKRNAGESDFNEIHRYDNFQVPEIPNSDTYIRNQGINCDGNLSDPDNNIFRSVIKYYYNNTISYILHTIDNGVKSMKVLHSDTDITSFQHSSIFVKDGQFIISTPGYIKVYTKSGDYCFDFHNLYGVTKYVYLNGIEFYIKSIVYSMKLIDTSLNNFKDIFRTIDIGLRYNPIEYSLVFNNYFQDTPYDCIGEYDASNNVLNKIHNSINKPFGSASTIHQKPTIKLGNDDVIYIISMDCIMISNDYGRTFKILSYHNCEFPEPRFGPSYLKQVRAKYNKYDQSITCAMRDNHIIKISKNGDISRIANVEPDLLFDDIDVVDAAKDENGILFIGNSYDREAESSVSVDNHMMVRTSNKYSEVAYTDILKSFVKYTGILLKAYTKFAIGGFVPYKGSMYFGVNAIHEHGSENIHGIFRYSHSDRTVIEIVTKDETIHTYSDYNNDSDYPTLPIDNSGLFHFDIYNDEIFYPIHTISDFKHGNPVFGRTKINPDGTFTHIKNQVVDSINYDMVVGFDEIKQLVINNIFVNRNGVIFVVVGNQHYTNTSHSGYMSSLYVSHDDGHIFTSTPFTYIRSSIGYGKCESIYNNKNSVETLCTNSDGLFIAGVTSDKSIRVISTKYNNTTIISPSIFDGFIQNGVKLVLNFNSKTKQLFVNVLSPDKVNSIKSFIVDVIHGTVTKASAISNPKFKGQLVSGFGDNNITLFNDNGKLIYIHNNGSVKIMNYNNIATNATSISNLVSAYRSVIGDKIFDIYGVSDSYTVKDFGVFPVRLTYNRIYRKDGIEYIDRKISLKNDQSSIEELEPILVEDNSITIPVIDRHQNLFYSESKYKLNSVNRSRNIDITYDITDIINEKIGSDLLFDLYDYFTVIDPLSIVSGFKFHENNSCDIIAISDSVVNQYTIPSDIGFTLSDFDTTKLFEISGYYIIWNFSKPNQYISINIESGECLQKDIIDTYVTGSCETNYNRKSLFDGFKSHNLCHDPESVNGIDGVFKDGVIKNVLPIFGNNHDENNLYTLNSLEKPLVSADRNLDKLEINHYSPSYPQLKSTQVMDIKNGEFRSSNNINNNGNNVKTSIIGHCKGSKIDPIQTVVVEIDPDYGEGGIKENVGTIVGPLSNDISPSMVSAKYDKIYGSNKYVCKFVDFTDDVLFGTRFTQHHMDNRNVLKYKISSVNGDWSGYNIPCYTSNSKFPTPKSTFKLNTEFSLKGRFNVPNTQITNYTDNRVIFSIIGIDNSTLLSLYRIGDGDYKIEYKSTNGLETVVITESIVENYNGFSMNKTGSTLVFDINGTEYTIDASTIDLESFTGGILHIGHENGSNFMQGYISVLDYFDYNNIELKYNGDIESPITMNSIDSYGSVVFMGYKEDKLILFVSPSKDSIETNHKLLGLTFDELDNGFYQSTIHDSIEDSAYDFSELNLGEIGFMSDVAITVIVNRAKGKDYCTCYRKHAVRYKYEKAYIELLGGAQLYALDGVPFTTLSEFRVSVED